jgi:hypothetical protein
MAIPGEVIEARAGWTDGLRDRLPPGAHVVVLGARAPHCLEGRQAGLAFRDTIAVATEHGFAMAALFRLPFDGTVAEQVMKTGTGGLWIDGCRIQGKYNDTELRPNARRHVKTKFNEVYGAYDLSADKCTSDLGYHNSLGRWPTNLVLVHKLGCTCEGTREIRNTGGGPNSRSGNTALGLMNDDVWEARPVKIQRYKGEDGKEAVPAWSCAPGCPVAALDEMSGRLTTNPGSITQDMASMGFHGGSGSARTVKADSGGASRFYPQFENRSTLATWIARLIYGGSAPSSASGSSSPT